MDFVTRRGGQQSPCFFNKGFPGDYLSSPGTGGTFPITFPIPIPQSQLLDNFVFIYRY